MFWGFFITNFVFWVGISHAGVMISAILRLSQAEWRRPMVRAAETMTVFALMTSLMMPLIHAGRPWRIFYWVFPYDWARGIWPDVRSPLVWDPVAIITYLTSSMLFVYTALIPDIAVIRDRSTGWRKTVYGILSLGVLVAASAAGVALSEFALLAGALGVGIGFGLQDLVNNFVSGLVLAFERPIRIGDTVEVGELLGDVRRIGLRASVVRTWEGAEVIVPNGTLLASQVINWTLSDRRRRIDVPVGVAYGTDPDRMLKILAEAVAKHPKVMPRPEPSMLFLGFGDSSLDFLARFWVGDMGSWFRIKSQVTLLIHTAIREASIEIPFPQRDLHLRTVDSAAGDALRGGQD